MRAEAGGQDLRDDGANLAGADDAGGAAVELAAQQAVEGEVALAHAVPGAVDLAVQRQDQRQGVLGDGVRGVGGDADDGDAGARGGGQVHVVEAGAAQGDQLRAAGRQHAQRIGVEAVVDEAAHGRAAGGERRGGGAERDLEVARLEDRSVRAACGGVRGVEERAVVRLGVEDGQSGQRTVGGHGGRWRG